MTKKRNIVSEEWLYLMRCKLNGDGSLWLGRCPTCRGDFQVDSDTLWLHRSCDVDAPCHPVVMLAVAKRVEAEKDAKRGGWRKKNLMGMDDH